MCDIVTDVFRFIRSGRRKDNWQKCAGFANVNVLKWITTYRLHSFVRSGLKHFLGFRQTYLPISSDLCYGQCSDTHVSGVDREFVMHGPVRTQRSRVPILGSYWVSTEFPAFWAHFGCDTELDWFRWFASTTGRCEGRKGSYRLDKFLFGHELFKTYHICFSWICQNQPDTGVWHTRAS